MSGSWPCQPCQSERQSPVAITRITAPPGGAAGVGRATTDAVVSAFILILLSNMIITLMAFG